jgi:CBS domain-containing protein
MMTAFVPAGPTPGQPRPGAPTKEPAMAVIRSRVVRKVVSLAASSTCADAARVLTQHGIGSVGVRKDGVLIGIVTERDLVGVMAAGKDPEQTELVEALRANAPVVSPEATDAECAELMRTHRTRHLAVVEGGAIVGLVSMLDLVDLVVEEKQWSIDQLQVYIRGGRAEQLSAPIATMFQHDVAAAG